MSEGNTNYTYFDDAGRLRKAVAVPVEFARLAERWPTWRRRPEDDAPPSPTGQDGPTAPKGGR